MIAKSTTPPIDKLVRQRDADAVKAAFATLAARRPEKLPPGQLNFPFWCQALADTLVALEGFVQRRDVWAVKALFVRLAPDRHRDESPDPPEQLRFSFLRALDEIRFAHAMGTSFELAMAKARERRRIAEAKEEARLAKLAKKRRRKLTVAEGVAEIIARGRTPGRMLELLGRDTARTWTLAELASELQAPENRISVAAHVLVGKGYLIRAQPGVFRGLCQP